MNQTPKKNRTEALQAVSYWFTFEVVNSKIRKLAQTVVDHSDKAVEKHEALVGEIDRAIEAGEFSARALAREMGVSAAFVSDVRKKQRRFGPDPLRRLAGGGGK